MSLEISHLGFCVNFKIDLEKKKGKKRLCFVVMFNKITMKDWCQNHHERLVSFFLFFEVIGDNGLLKVDSVTCLASATEVSSLCKVGRENCAV